MALKRPRPDYKAMLKNHFKELIAGDPMLCAYLETTTREDMIAAVQEVIHEMFIEVAVENGKMGPREENQ